ncbi:MAG: Sir2 family NAD-dependent protein deacetylase, partial [Candidatus Caldatribacteriota bacterium]
IMEIHGNLNQAICIRCGERISSQELIKRIDENKNGIPYCQCGGVLKPDVVLFGEVLSNIEEAIDEASKAELFLAIGSSLQVSPANLLPEYSMAKKGKLVIINYMQTYLDKKAAIVVNQDIGLFLTILCQHLNI